MIRSERDDRITKSLAAAHDVVNARHEQSRANLLESIADTIPTRGQARHAPAVWHCVVGGLGLSAVASAILLMFWLLGPLPPAVAFERMAKALDQVTTYSFRMDSVQVSRNGKGRRVSQTQVGRLRTEPIGLHASLRIVEAPQTSTAASGAPKTLVDIEETHAAGRRGIIIDHLKDEYWRIDEQIAATDIPGASSQVLIYMVRQRRGRVLRDLGEKTVNGRIARGLEILLNDAEPATDLGPASPEGDVGQAAGWDWRNVKVEAWVDPKTDLPIEFRCTRRGDDFETNYHFTELKWNVEFAANAFDTMAPDGYKELDGSPYAQEQ